MKRIKLMLTILTLAALLIACSNEEANNNKDENENHDNQNNNSLVSNDENHNEAGELDGIDTAEEEAFAKIMSVESLDDLKIERKQLDNVIGDDGNYPSYSDQEIVKEFADDEGMIEFDLDDQPIVSVQYEDGQITNVTNYSSSFIDINDHQALVLPKEDIEVIYNVIVNQDPYNDISGYTGDGDIDFRSFDELTLTELAMIQTIGFTGHYLVLIEDFIESEDFNSDAYEVTMEEASKFAEPMVLIPAPQTPTDYQLFEILTYYKEGWFHLVNISEPEDEIEEFTEIYMQLREVFNNFFAYLFVAIGDVE